MVALMHSYADHEILDRKGEKFGGCSEKAKNKRLSRMAKVENHHQV
jgi:hypothetical protein